jgi:hypothetical protein
LIYLPEASPPVTVFSIVHSNLLFLSPSDVDTEPLLVLEFLRRVVDVLEEFVGAPLLATKLQTSYDVVAQLLTEMCDAGLVSSTEINSLQENVETPNWMNKFLSGVGLPGLAMCGFAIDFEIANIIISGHHHQALLHLIHTKPSCPVRLLLLPRAQPSHGDGQAYATHRMNCTWT